MASCYTRSLEEAEKKGCRSVAFPAISTGVYGYPKEEAARIAVSTIQAYFAKGAHSAIEEVVLVAFDATSEALYQNLLNESQRA